MNQTEARKAYKHFDRRSKLISTALLVAGIICLAFFQFFLFLDSLIPTLIAITALVIWFIALCVIVTRLNRTRQILYHQAFGDVGATEHTGLFKELMEEFERNNFDGLTDAEVIFAEAHSNSIELELHRRRRTYHVVIDPGAVFLVAEEESANPREYEFPMANFHDIGQIFHSIRNVVEQ